MATPKNMATFNQHLILVVNDPAFKKAYDAIPDNEQAIAMHKQVLADFGIDSNKFGMSQQGFARIMNPYTLFSAGWLHYDSSVSQFNVTIDANAKHTDIEDLWKMMQKNKQKLGIRSVKERSPEHPELLYAIFKARRQKYTFTTIYDQFKLNKLTGYKTLNAGLFDTARELEDYYHTYYQK